MTEDRRDDSQLPGFARHADDEEREEAGRPSPVAAAAAAYAPAQRRPFRSTLAMSAAFFLLVLGLIVVLAAVTALSQPPRPDLGPSYAMTSLITQVALLIVGALNVGAAAGVFLHAGWGRQLGMLLSILGLAVGAIFYLGPLASFNVPLTDPLRMATIAALIGYSWCILVLLVSGSHFSRAKPELR